MPSDAVSMVVVSTLSSFENEAHGSCMFVVDTCCVQILMDGHPLSDFATTDLGRAIAVIDSRSSPFTGSIMENLCLGAAADDASRAIALCQRLLVHDDILQLRHGYDTMIRAQTDEISTYLRFALCLIRSVLSGAQVLILNDVPVLTELLPALLLLRDSHVLVILTNKATFVGLQDNHLTNVEMHSAVYELARVNTAAQSPTSRSASVMNPASSSLSASSPVHGPFMFPQASLSRPASSWDLTRTDSSHDLSGLASPRSPAVPLTILQRSPWLASSTSGADQPEITVVPSLSSVPRAQAVMTIRSVPLTPRSVTSSRQQLLSLPDSPCAAGLGELPQSRGCTGDSDRTDSLQLQQVQSSYAMFEGAALGTVATVGHSTTGDHHDDSDSRPQSRHQLEASESTTVQSHEDGAYARSFGP